MYSLERLPSLGLRVIDLVITAPNFERSTNSSTSFPYPKVPLAAIIELKTVSLILLLACHLIFH